MRFVVSVLLIGTVFAFATSPTFADYSYTSPSNFTQTPRDPEVMAGGGAIIRKDLFTLILSEGTTPWDAYISYGYVKKTNLVRLCRYWQVSDIYEFKLRSHFNNAVISPQKDTLISFAYNTDFLKVFPFVYFPEQTLKIVETDDNGLTWTMLKNSTVDVENNTVSAITKLNRGYIIVAGFVNPKIMCNYDNSVKGISTIPASVSPITPIVSTLQFYYQVLIDILQFRSEQPVL